MLLLIRNVEVHFVATCCIAARNNEMMDLIAKYFFRFLHELTVSSILVTFVLEGRSPRLTPPLTSRDAPMLTYIKREEQAWPEKRNFRVNPR